MNRLILHCLLALSTLVLAAPALASSANGTENALGNAMNPSGTDEYPEYPPFCSY